MKELIAQANVYGNITLFQQDSGWTCYIKRTTLGCERLEVHSGFNCKTPEEALLSVIKKAEALFTVEVVEVKKVSFWSLFKQGRTNGT